MSITDALLQALPHQIGIERVGRIVQGRRAQDLVAELVVERIAGSLLTAVSRNTCLQPQARRRFSHSCIRSVARPNRRASGMMSRVRIRPMLRMGCATANPAMPPGEFAAPSANSATSVMALRRMMNPVRSICVYAMPGGKQSLVDPPQAIEIGGAIIADDEVHNFSVQAASVIGAQVTMAELT